MAAMGKTDDLLLASGGAGQGKRWDWVWETQLIKSHQDSRSQIVRHSQKLRSTERPDCDKKELRRAMKGHPRSCFVFGGKQDAECFYVVQG